MLNLVKSIKKPSVSKEIPPADGCGGVNCNSQSLIRGGHGAIFLDKQDSAIYNSSIYQKYNSDDRVK